MRVGHGGSHSATLNPKGRQNPRPNPSWKDAAKPKFKKLVEAEYLFTKMSRFMQVSKFINKETNEDLLGREEQAIT